MTRRQELIEAASKRLLSISEQAELVLLFWKGSRDEFRKLVNKAYATAKQYDRDGGANVLHALDNLFSDLGSSDFRVLYRAAKM